MGLREHWRFVRRFVQHAAATGEQWAVITRVGRRAAGMVALDLEIHTGGREPFTVSTITSVPRHVAPRVGQHVAFSIPPSSDDLHTHYEVEWDKPPRYGTSQERDELRNQVAGLVQPAPGESAATHAERQRRVQELFDRLGARPRQPPH
ncbi:hypothetical protein GCM10010464_71980 [Pseudonocardia yunnanensis]|uniref:Uncharacterized protein n=1 Tax=Pseudonocardia yunnanensis TaxID=58107 RepID=A0ABW4F8C3_9PSEU